MHVLSENNRYRVFSSRESVEKFLNYCESDLVSTCNDLFLYMYVVMARGRKFI